MRKTVVLITGANGEMGHGLIERLGQTSQHGIVALDLHPTILAHRQPPRSPPGATAPHVPTRGGS